MAKYYQDFVGLNTFIYEAVGWDPESQGNLLDATTKQTLIAGGYSDPPLVENVFLGTGTGYADLELNHIRNTFTSPSVGSVLEGYKNFKFSHILSSTASFFPALMLHRNGPYGYPMWKQTRVGENPLTRRQKKENVLTIVQEPGAEFTFTRNSKTRTQRARFGNILKFTETPVVSKFKPISVFGSIITEKGAKRIRIAAPLGNSIVQFNNAELNEELGLVDLKSKDYEDTKKLYLDGALFNNESALDVFEVLLYKETVYPPQLRTYRQSNRQRTTFYFPWRDLRSDRVPTGLVDNGFGSNVRQSIWPMDAYRGFDTAATIVSGKKSSEFDLLNNEDNTVYVDNGILQNQYSFSTSRYTNFSGVNIGVINTTLRPAPIYSRKHFISTITTVTGSSAVNNFCGMDIEGVTSGSGRFGPPIPTASLPAGEAKWEAGSQSGKNPFYDSYDEFIQGPRQLGKDHTIIPEFRMSNHVSFYESNSFIDENLEIFEITGGLSNTTGSNQNNFYEIYSNTDFLKNFEMVKNDNKSIGEPLKITLKCKAIKKLLPYEGFYPQQRTVQIAKQFFDSFSGSIAISASFNDSPSGYAKDQPLIGMQNIITPLFAPGILFNSIKSGVAVDYPLVSKNLVEGSLTDRGSVNVATSNGDSYISLRERFRLSGAIKYLQIGPSASADPSLNGIRDGLIFDKRVPFEALISPEKLQGNNFFCNEPDRQANLTSSTTINSNAGDRLYSLMMHNFLAETSNFFLQNKKYTTYFSKPSNELAEFQEGKEYIMRVKMYKTTNNPEISNVSGGVGDKFFTAPQYSTSSRENFTMYSRPTAFGPPSLLAKSLLYVSYSSGIMYDNTRSTYGNNSRQGENYPFTPPYYHGQAWADISFTPKTSGTFTVKQILNEASASYYRYVDPDTDTSPISIYDKASGETKANTGAYATNYIYNINALQLSASVNLFTQERDKSGDLNEETARWVIQSKWESPMLNFSHLGSKDSVTLPQNASQSVPRGMWHQNGLIEQDQSKGVFMQIEDVDENWLRNVLGKDPNNIKSLADHLDFSTVPKRLGDIADEKVLREAVVAVPFVEENGLRKYFHIPRIDIDQALDQNTTTGQSVSSMVRKMEKFVFPPSMDFLNNKSIEPFAMYIFEFKHTLKKQDLADIWQGLYPQITTKFEKAESEISHPLLAQHLLGGGASVIQTSDGEFLDTGDQGTPLPSKIRWMVFKVKQKAKTNYWKTQFGAEGSKVEEVPQNTFNWPYDFFSLVELAKIDSTVAIGQFEDGGLRKIVKPQGKIEEAKKEVGDVLSSEAQKSVTSPLFIPDKSTLIKF